MKQILLFLLVAGSLAACQNGDDQKMAARQNEHNMTTMQWTDSVQDLGTITEGQELKINFHFKNTGDKPLVIRSVRPSCGCTIADYPKRPIPPGQDGVIAATFNSHGKEGIQHKTLNVTANTTGSMEHTLHFQVEVEKTKS